MTAAPHVTELDMIDHLSGRDDLTVDDLASLPEDLRYELIDGRLVLTPRALPAHQFLSLMAATAIHQHRPRQFIVNVEQAVLRNRRNELHPDVAIIRKAGAGTSPVLPADVELVVEIISRSSRFYDRQDKLKWYADLGIPSYWIIDPLGERVTFTQFVLGEDGAYRQQMHTDALVTVDLPWPITLDLPEWTIERDEIAEAVHLREQG